jgi:hypothetical protein
MMHWPPLYLMAELFVPLAGITVLVYWLRHMHERHGLGPLLWRWHSGHSLDGCHRTNATWLHRSSDTLHHTGHAIWWHHRPRLWRAGVRCGSELVLLGVVAGLILDFTVAVLVLAVLVTAGAAWATWWTFRHARNVYFWWRWVRPLKRALELHHGIPPKLKISPDRSSVRLSLPPGWADTQREREKVTALVTSRLGIEIDPDSSEDVQFRARARAPHVLFSAASPPPDRVELSDPRTRAAIAACAPAEVMAGTGCRGKEIVRSVDSEAPMVGIGMPTGAGKSATAGNIAAQLARHGAIIAVLDYKMVSHRWAKGLPNVAYASRIWQIHELLLWLEAEVDRRNELVDRYADIDGRVDGYVGPRLVVIDEEKNTTQRKLARYWRELRAEDRTLPTKSPAVDAADTLLFIGRAALVTDILIAQRLSAAAVSGAGGNADARENLCYRWLCDPGVPTWRMNGNDLPCPVPRGIPGRHYLVGPADVTEVQTVYGTNRELRDLAVSGDVGVPQDGMPFTTPQGRPQQPSGGDDWTWRADVIQVPELVSAGGPRTGASTGSGTQGWSNTVRGTPGPVLGHVLDADLVGEAVQAGAQDELVTISEACDLGIAKVNRAAARRRSTRDSRHPASQGKRGREFLYAAIDLADYYARAA